MRRAQPPVPDSVKYMVATGVSGPNGCTLHTAHCTALLEGKQMYVPHSL